MMDINIFTPGGGINWAGKGPAEGAIRSEKRENYKNWTHTKIKFPIIFIQIFFLYDGYIKFSWLWGRGGGSGVLRPNCFFIIIIISAMQ